MKRIGKLLLVLLCVCLLGAQMALAAPVSTLTLHNTGATAHTFEIYQIFTGDLSVNAGGQKVLSNIVWGSGVTAAGQSAMGSAAAKAETIVTEADGKAFADALASGGYLTGAVTRTVAPGASESVGGLEPGYYLVRDQAGTQSGENSAYTSYLLAVIGDVTVSVKLGVPSVEKKVRDINDTEDGDISDNAWQDSADHDVGDMIPYLITGTLPDNYADYGTYTYRFTDTMSAGLTYQADARVFVDNGGTETEITTQASITPAAVTPGATLTVAFADLKAVTGAVINKDSRIIVRYTAQLNGSAVVGGTGNANTVVLTYSNDPNPGGTGTGTTPQDKTVVFTYSFTVDKKDDAGNPLANAGFTLQKKDSLGVWQTVQTIAPGSATSFSFSGLDDGDYKLVESAVPTGYNKIEDIEFKITAVHDTAAADPALTSLNGAVTDGEVITLSGTQQAAVSLSTGTISTEIVNKPGSILPSTGGVGTTLFYAAGGLIAVAAVVLLIAKKRTKAE